MARTMSEKDYKLVDLVCEDYIKSNSTDKKCPYCKTLLTKKDNGGSYRICCQTEGCFKAIFRGI